MDAQARRMTPPNYPELRACAGEASAAEIDADLAPEFTAGERLDGDSGTMQARRR